MLGTKTHLYGYISCGTNSLPLVHIYHLKTEGPLLNENHKICKITQTTTKFFHNGWQKFWTLHYKIFLLWTHVQWHFPYSIPHNRTTEITSLYIATTFSKEFPTASRKKLHCYYYYHHCHSVFRCNHINIMSASMYIKTRGPVNGF